MPSIVCGHRGVREKEVAAPKGAATSGLLPGSP